MKKANYVNFHGQIEVENPHQSMRGNLTIMHHKATLEHEFDKIEIVQIHETIRISVMCSSILCGIIGCGIFLMCIIKGFKDDRVPKKFDPVTKVSNDRNEMVGYEEGLEKATKTSHEPDNKRGGTAKNNGEEIEGGNPEDDARNGKVTNPELLRCSACFLYKNNCTMNGIKHLTYVRCAHCFMSPQPCDRH